MNKYNKLPTTAYTKHKMNTGICAGDANTEPKWNYDGEISADWWRKRVNILSTWIIMILITIGVGITVVILRLFYFLPRLPSWDDITTCSFYM